MTHPLDPAEPVYPHPAIPTIFADGVANFVNSSEVFKFYLYRADPSSNGVGPPQSQPIAQIIMPMAGALGSIAFLQAVVMDLSKQYPAVAKAWQEAQAFQAETYKTAK